MGEPRDEEHPCPGDGEDRGRGAPICSCGVTTIPAETTSLDRPRFVCENPDCEAFGIELG